jgi:hypothetical protein
MGKEYVGANFKKIITVNKKKTGKVKATDPGYVGVRPHGDQWEAEFWNKLTKQRVYVGRFDTPEEANETRLLRVKQAYGAPILDFLKK